MGEIATPFLADVKNSRRFARKLLALLLRNRASLSVPLPQDFALTIADSFTLSILILLMVRRPIFAVPDIFVRHITSLHRLIVFNSSLINHYFVGSTQRMM
jgi:hypothetical protein